MQQRNFFHRQEQVSQWNQPLLSSQTALVLGVGGVGSGVAMVLARLGVGKIILVDFDSVEETNLNRQMLFCKDDVGRKKVEAARDGLEKSHNLVSKLVISDIDAVKKWDVVVEFAKESSVVFNCIDYGKFFDFAVSSLAKKLGIDYVTGASYGQVANAEFFSSSSNCCWACNNFNFESKEGEKSEELAVLERLSPSNILTHLSIEFAPKDETFTTASYGSSALPALFACDLIVSNWVNSLFRIFEESKVPNWSFFSLADFSMTSVSVERNEKCFICREGGGK